MRHTRKAPLDNGVEWSPATVPDSSDLSEVRKAALKCTACHLYKRATQTVFGEGPERAPILLVGEQPGDQEDLTGKPFIGPAGRILDRALEEAGIDRNKSLCHQRRQTFQMGAERETTHP